MTDDEPAVAAGAPADEKAPEGGSPTLSAAECPPERAVEKPFVNSALFANEEQRLSWLGTKPLFGKRPLCSVLLDASIWAAVTAYTVALWVLGKTPDGGYKEGYHFWTVLWCFFSLRLFARHVCVTKLFWNPARRAFDACVARPTRGLGRQVKFGGLLACTLAAMLINAVCTKSDESDVSERVQSWAGVIFLLAIGAASSRRFKAINLQTVAVGVTLQFVFALLVLRWETGAELFGWLSSFIADFLDYNYDGLVFLVGYKIPKASFAVNVLPAIIFFCSFVQVVYYWGGMQYLISTLGSSMMKLMDTSGAESLVAAASPFVGQVENALLVLPYLEYMTKSELHAIMCCGFATISGSVLMGYVSIVKDPRLILTACVMSIPASLVMTKLRYPEEEESITKGKIRVPEQKEKDVNFLHAAGNGAATGVHLVLLIAASILALVALYSAANDFVGWTFYMLGIHRHDGAAFTGSDKVSVAYILSYLFWPFAFFIGVPAGYARRAAEIMSEKIVVNEFVAYTHLQEVFEVNHLINHRTFVLLSFALCGFANIGSIGIQVSALGGLCPGRKAELAQLALSAMLLGSMSTWLTAAVAGSML